MLSFGPWNHSSTTLSAQQKTTRDAMFCRPSERLPKAQQVPRRRLKVKTTAAAADEQAKISWKRAAQLKRAHRKAVARATQEIRTTMQTQAVADVEAMSNLPYQGTQPMQPVVPDWIHDYVDQSHDLRLLVEPYTVLSVEASPNSPQARASSPKQELQRNPS